jgi:hypothetical protein
MITPDSSKLKTDSNKDTENKAIFKALLKSKQPQTRRQISEDTGIEIGNLCRCLFNLVYKSKALKIASINPCKTTGISVYHYYFNDNLKLKKGSSNG